MNGDSTGGKFINSVLFTPGCWFPANPYLLSYTDSRPVSQHPRQWHKARPDKPFLSGAPANSHPEESAGRTHSRRPRWTLCTEKSKWPGVETGVRTSPRPDEHAPQSLSCPTDQGEDGRRVLPRLSSSHIAGVLFSAWSDWKARRRKGLRMEICTPKLEFLL